MPFALPIFPLPTVVLFPNVFLPLHIFEPRYRQMIADSLAGDRIIGMVLLCPDTMTTTKARRSLSHRVLGAHHARRTARRRQMRLVLRGLEIHHSERSAPADSRLYRSAVITPLDDMMRDGERDERHERKRRSNSDAAVPRHAEPLPARCNARRRPGECAGAVSRIRSGQKLALLERHGILARCRSMVELWR
jgi:hypothetical protein